MSDEAKKLDTEEARLAKEYDEDYFLRGKETGKSLYENYRWMPDLTIPMCQAIERHCRFRPGDRILDFGCARGYTVKALRELGYNAFGVDVSRWAIANCDPQVRPYCFLPEARGTTCPTKFHWIIAKDVLEHIPYVDKTIDTLMESAISGIFIVVPLSKFEGGRYVVPSYEEDSTHLQRHNILGWAKMVMRPGWTVEMTYRLSGVKDNYSNWEYGNGFITARRHNGKE